MRTIEHRHCRFDPHLLCFMITEPSIASPCRPFLTSTGKHCSPQVTSIIRISTVRFGKARMAALNAFSISALLYIAAALIVSLLAKTVYRLTCHPLAAFPGPKLAAITNFYGAFFDLSASSSSYTKKLPALHAKYGQSTILLPFACSKRK